MWYRWTAPVTNTVTFTLASSAFIPRLTVFPGSDLGDLGVGTPGTRSSPSAVSLEASAGTTYRIRVLDAGPASGAFTLSWAMNTPPPPTAFSVTPDTATVPANGGTGTLTVAVNGGAGAWTATSSAPAWLTITSGASGSDNGTVAYAAAFNTGTVGRQARLTVAGQTITIGQAAPLVSGGTLKMMNTSTRVQVGTGASVLITGVVFNHAGTRNYLVRAAGPALAAFGITGALADPVLTVFNGSTRIASNDNWDAALARDFSSVGAFTFAPGSRDAALVLSLQAGNYSFQVSGADNSTGVALVEVYELP